ncbi:IS3 family transposase [Endozoicomonas sp.]|nr:IS3 family transposase [Endozoicomonas sp.]
MARYSDEFKESVIQKMMPPNNVSVSELVRDTGISDVTLYTWRRKAISRGVPVPGDGKKPDQWTPDNQLAVIIETAPLNETELAEYCRKKGLFAEQIQQWKEAFISSRSAQPDRRPNQRKKPSDEHRKDKQTINKLERELKRKDKALAETAALLVLTKKARGNLGGTQGRLIPLPDRQNAVKLIKQAVRDGARQSQACQALGLSERTVQRWIQGDNVMPDNRKDADRKEPANKLSEAERQMIIDVCNSDRFKSLPPSQIVPTLADEGQYIGSERTFYRVLHDKEQQHRRGRAASPRQHKPTSHCATEPNQVWSWDITFLRSAVRGRFYYLYLVIDIYSRVVVAWEIHENESAEHASELINKACIRHGIVGASKPLVLHSDNGSAMKGSTMLATLQRLGVVSSFSRPRVSDDNPYSEAIFRTLKYRPDYPCTPFADINAARHWVHGFTQWYNEKHKHSGLKFLTPGQRHRGEAEKFMDNRKTVYELAKERHPERWGTRAIRNWELCDAVWLNPDKSTADQLSEAA